MTVPVLEINPDYLQMLMLKVRGIMGKEQGEDERSGSDAVDDESAEILEELPGDLSREEVVEEIQGLSAREQAELVALMWLGRGDAEPEEWQDLIDQAVDRAEVPTENYLLDHPHVADHWAEGLEKLGLGGRVDEVEEV